MSEPITKAEAVEKLRLAERLVREAARALDTAELDPCPTCGGRHWSNRTEAQVALKLSDAANKLAKYRELDVFSTQSPAGKGEQN